METIDDTSYAWDHQDQNDRMRRLRDALSGLNLNVGVTVGYDARTFDRVFQMNEDRFRHTVTLGRTGSGKSNHVKQMECQDIRSGAGCFILAVHEDDALYALASVPEHRLGDVILIDAANPEYLPRMPRWTWTRATRFPSTSRSRMPSS